ncbi:hypothetical protein L210DRAFT_3506070 [Boletus edulis BED1]|uniref:Uncharacterized protein n=1 Tax=Boletus edulis BED1 TaxID=1328754 RepID=A0AAD4BN77_BOLED|nr:hypothetical protein L210DRAFT_3506070 [Boletus edulis BED1]
MATCRATTASVRHYSICAPVLGEHAGPEVLRLSYCSNAAIFGELFIATPLSAEMALPRKVPRAERGFPKTLSRHKEAIPKKQAILIAAVYNYLATEDPYPPKVKFDRVRLMDWNNLRKVLSTLALVINTDVTTKILDSSALAGIADRIIWAIPQFKHSSRGRTHDKWRYPLQAKNELF